MTVKISDFEEKISLTVSEILNNLAERKGIGDELDSVDDDIYLEIVDDLAAIIKSNFK